MKAIALSRLKVLHKIEEAKNNVFEVTFKKVDGSKRVMLAKQGVEHNLKGGKNTVMQDSNDYLTTFDIVATGYRTINLATITKLKVNGVSYKIV